MVLSSDSRAKRYRLRSEAFDDDFLYGIFGVSEHISVMISLVLLDARYA